MCYLLVEQIKSRNYISTTDISENLCNINKTNEDIIIIWTFNYIH